MREEPDDVLLGFCGELLSVPNHSRFNLFINHVLYNMKGIILLAACCYRKIINIRPDVKPSYSKSPDVDFFFFL